MSFMLHSRLTALAVYVALWAFILGPLALAQEEPLTFEVVAQTEYDNDALQFSNLLFFPDSILLVVADGGVFDLTHPYSGSWTLRFEGRFTDGPTFLTTDGILFSATQNLGRSADGGYTWTNAFPDADTFVELPPDAPGGTAFLTDGDDRTVSPERSTVARSTDGGLTWTPHAPGPSVLDRVFIRTLAYAPASSERRTVGTVVGVGVSGAVFSLDGGVTWQASDFVGNIFAENVMYSPTRDLFVTGATANAPDFGNPRGGIWVSEDGQAWTFRGRVPSDSDTPMAVTEAPDGTWWAIRPGEPDGAVFSSVDGGRAWTERGRLDGMALVGQEFLRTESLRIGPEGRVWLATTGEPGNESRGAVLRSVERVVVASEETPVGTPGEAVLGAPYPNPTRDAVTVPLTLAQPAEVRVVVTDLLGHEVAVLIEGRRAAGVHTLAFDTGALASGVYVVHATVGGAATETQRFSVVR
ncbi:MAG: T9SS type A sorting domain-containing protein [Bacteroidota bacterium]